MARCKTLGLGSAAATVVAVFLSASSATAEPYGGFNSCNTRATYIDYGPRYVQPSETVTHMEQPGSVTYATTTSAYAQPVYTRTVYAQPVRRTTTVVQSAPIAEYVQPVAYGRGYATGVYGYGYGGYGGYGAFGYSGAPVIRTRAYYGGSRRGHHSYGRHYAPRSRVYVGRSHRGPYRSFARSGHGHHERSWGFSIGGGHGGGGVSFRYSH